ncbi:MAG: phosphate signaling complex protein PhoU [Eubacteriales bacterium]|nr:phosphate signaling complex protein PhoU [Eubacteriales bacterium]
MRSRFDSQLEQLNDELIQMGTLVENSITGAVEALIEQDAAKANKVIEFDMVIDRKEQDIEALCLKLLLQQQPVARDLRLISAALKMITDMERIGDQAADISEIAGYLSDCIYIKKLETIPEMAREAVKMVKGSISAYVKKDLELAREIIKADDIVDRLFLTVKNDLIKMIHDDADNGGQAMDLLMIAKYLERIGDHATNIAEWVEFSMTGVHKNQEIEERMAQEHLKFQATNGNLTEHES